MRFGEVGGCKERGTAIEDSNYGPSVSFVLTRPYECGCSCSPRSHPHNRKSPPPCGVSLSGDTAARQGLAIPETEGACWTCLAERPTPAYGAEAEEARPEWAGGPP